MNRVMILGSSHIGAYIMGLRDLVGDPAIADIEFTTMGSPGHFLIEAQFKNGVLASDDPRVVKNFEWSSGGRTEMRVADYDTIVLSVGQSAHSHHWAWTFSNDGTEFDVPTISTTMSVRIQETMPGCLALPLARQIAAEHENVNVIFVGAPFLPETLKETQLVLKTLKENKNGVCERLDRVRKFNAARIAEFSRPNLRFVAPAPQLLEETGNFTKAQYIRGAMSLGSRLQEEYARPDQKHMNGDYGAQMIKHIFAS